MFSKYLFDKYLALCKIQDTGSQWGMNLFSKECHTMRGDIFGFHALEGGRDVAGAIVDRGKECC